MPVLGQGGLKMLERQAWGVCWGHSPLFSHQVRDHPMSDPLVALYIISKLGSSHAHVVSVVIVKHGSRLLWHSSYQGWGLCPFLLILDRLWPPWPIEYDGRAGKAHEASTWSSHKALSPETPSWEAPSHHEKPNPHGEAMCRQMFWLVLQPSQPRCQTWACRNQLESPR